MRYLALVAASLILTACSRQGTNNQSANGASANGANNMAASSGAVANGVAGNGSAAAPAPVSSDPVALAAANLARDEQGRDPGSPSLEEVYPAARGMPADVQEYIVRHHGCMHWGGEPESGLERKKQIDEAVAELCTGIDQLGQQIRSRYAGNQQVLDRIKDLETLEQ